MTWLLPAAAGASVAAVLLFVLFWQLGRAFCRVVHNAIYRSL